MNTILALLAPLFAHASSAPVLAGLPALHASGAAVIASDDRIGVGFARLTPAQEEKLSRFQHAAGKCAGYEVLPASSLTASLDALAELGKRVRRDREGAQAKRAQLRLEKKPEIVTALAELKAENLRATVGWLESYPSRYNRLSDPNQHVAALEAKLRELVGAYAGRATVERVKHTSTRQDSLRVRLEGKARPAEIVVLGAHLDSINHEGGDRAPGADDDASGAANLVEALRVLVTRAPADRTVELYWYAGEESGLLGSAEIAKQYKQAGKNVVAVLQLDMTGFAGSGELVIGNVTDFTAAWLRDYLVSLNEAYLGARLIPDECGYGCSDHASWYRQGFPTLYAFESDTPHMNEALHTTRDVSSLLSFTHMLAFSKIAVAMAMDLGNSTAREPR